MTGKLDDPEWRRERARKAGRAKWAKADRQAESDAARARLYARFADEPDPDAALADAMARLRLLSRKAAERRKREAAAAPQGDPASGRTPDRPVSTAGHRGEARSRISALRFTQRLVDAGVAPSTGSTGDSYDALAENLWSTHEGRAFVLDCHHVRRSHQCRARPAALHRLAPPAPHPTGLGGLSPEEYEDAYHRAQHDHPDR